MNLTYIDLYKATPADRRVGGDARAESAAQRRLERWRVDAPLASGSGGLDDEDGGIVRRVAVRVGALVGGAVAKAVLGGGDENLNMISFTSYRSHHIVNII